MSTLVNRTLGPKAAAQAITKSLKHRRPVMLWGAPGIGKSDIVKQIGAATGREVIDIRLALWDPTDVKGMPYMDTSTNQMNWAHPCELPSDPDSNAIIFFDEIVSAPPATQAAAYQLILDRKVGKYVLPKGVDIIGAGNRESDRGITYKMPAPLANRFIHLEMSISFDDWHEWAVCNDIHPEVVGFLSFAKQDLFDFDPKSSSRSFATPRSWRFVSDILKDDAEDDSISDLISGAVGDGLATKFMAHRKVCGKMPKPIDVLEGKVKTLKVKEISALYALIVSLCYELKELGERKTKKFYEYADKYFEFIMANFPTELVVMGAKVAICNYNLDLDASKLKSFDEFYNRFGKYIS